MPQCWVSFRQGSRNDGCVLTGGAGHKRTHERSDGNNPISMKSCAGEVQSFTRVMLMRRTAFQLVDLGDKNNGGKAYDLLEQRICLDSNEGSSGSATAIIVQRQCRNTVRANSTNHGHSSAERAPVKLHRWFRLAA